MAIIQISVMSVHRFALNHEYEPQNNSNHFDFRDSLPLPCICRIIVATADVLMQLNRIWLEFGLWLGFGLVFVLGRSKTTPNLVTFISVA